MSAKELLLKVVECVNSLIYVVGVMTIWNYGFTHWPRGTDIVAGVLGAGILVWFFWMFFVRPFREGLMEAKAEGKGRGKEQEQGQD